MIDSKVRREVLAEVEQLRDELVRLVVDTVRIPSINPNIFGVNREEVLGGETRVVEHLDPIMREMGLEVDKWDSDPGRHNLVGVCRGAGGGKSLIFNGHVDVTPPGPLEDWTIADPWSGKITDGKIYGRGAADMKGGNASALIGLKAVLNAGYQPKGDVILENVVGEEWMETAAGIGATIERGYVADAAIVVEATSFPHRLAISPASGNCYDIKINFKGKALHSLLRGETIRPGGLGAQAGVSSIDKAMIIYQAMLRLEEEWGHTKCHPLWKHPGKFVIYCTGVYGRPEDGPTLIPARTTMSYEILTPPPESFVETKKEVEEAIRKSAETDDWLRDNPPEVDWWIVWPGFEVPVDAPICRAIDTAYQAALGEAPEYYGYACVADATFLNQAGIPTICIGPGTVQTLHAANEHVSIDELVDAAKIFALSIVEWCGV